MAENLPFNSCPILCYTEGGLERLEDIYLRRGKEMLVQGIMTRNVIAVLPDTPVIEALKIMKEHNFRRLPVVDKDGHLVGLVTEPRLERVKPRTATPLLWQITYLISHTTVGDVMRKR